VILAQRRTVGEQIPASSVRANPAICVCGLIKTSTGKSLYCRASVGASELLRPCCRAGPRSRPGRFLPPGLPVLSQEFMCDSNGSQDTFSTFRKSRHRRGVSHGGDYDFPDDGAPIVPGH
jgi:hypothetical protein